MPKVNIADVCRLPIPLAPLAEQTKVGASIDAASRRIAKVAESFLTAQTALFQIDQSILAKAFRGELVPQDPADEPASVLLERLRSGQTGASANGTPRRKARS